MSGEQAGQVCQTGIFILFQHDIMNRLAHFSRYGTKLSSGGHDNFYKHIKFKTFIFGTPIAYRMAYVNLLPQEHGICPYPHTFP